jgi:starch synthase
MLSFIKGGLVYADFITTVSPSYALEIQTTEFGYGLEGLLATRNASLGGIINGIDTEYWNPETDTYIAETYSAATLNKKRLNKADVQLKFGLPINDKVPLFSLIGRLVEQKGIDLLVECLPEMMAMNLQFVLLGSGDKVFEKQLQVLADLYPEKMAIRLGYDEALAHVIEAGADVFLMPSKFEPCGLNQMYSQRYGTIPIVRKTGGLADTVTDTLPETLVIGSASGLVFNEASAGALLEAIKRALILYSVPNIWKKMQVNAMSQDFSWQRSAEQYLALYENL